ncbi:MAG: hypothetical protein A2059_00190 [Ignavibacteria bacterium GWA2_55_25]|nr:MAG: hypothetical protein A2059_00190 [Ignavibacteria bacterium GWA2_55_25]
MSLFFLIVMTASFLYSQEKEISPSQLEETYFVIVEDLPEPIGGMAAIQAHVIYPEIARRAGIQGTVYVEVFIDERGDVVKAIVKKGIGAGCDESAIAAVKKTKFRPGIQGGKPAKVRLAIPIRFRLGTVTNRAEEMKKLKHSITKPTVIIASGPKALEGTIQYPEAAINNQIEGMVQVQVLLRKDKLVKGITLMGGVMFGIDRDVMRAVQLYDFTKDPDFALVKEDTTFSVLVQFILPVKK